MHSFTFVPFGMTPQEISKLVLIKVKVRAFHDELDLCLKSFLAGNTGLHCWWLVGLPRKSQSRRFSGVWKFRMPGLAVKYNVWALCRTFRAVEAYQAPASGAIDGTEWIGPWADEKAGFQEITVLLYRWYA
jgi:TRAP-type mannitol/chloroaromatic compound transport system substrate-binding protein